ncbi:MAG: hypothetical protein Q4D41_07330 [Prevotellaceae bacterium]|nr:hypothetical protein [Prevotellaceae bacterium]
MGLFFDIIGFSASSLLWGLLIALVCVVLFAFIIKGWWKNAMFTPPTYIIGFVLFVLLAIQFTLIIGSIKIINKTEYYEQEITSVINSINIENTTTQQTDSIIKELKSEYPIIENYINEADYHGKSLAQMPHTIALNIKSYLKSYILRRMLWALGFIIVGIICTIKSISVGNGTRRHRQYSQNSRRPIDSGHSRKHIRRRR